MRRVGLIKGSEGWEVLGATSDSLQLSSWQGRSESSHCYSSGKPCSAGSFTRSCCQRAGVVTNPSLYSKLEYEYWWFNDFASFHAGHVGIGGVF